MEGYDVYPVVDAIAGTSVEAHRAGLERRVVLVGLSALVLASDVIGGIAPGIGVMLAARAVLGVGVGGSWVFGAGAAITLVSERARGTAMAVVSAVIAVVAQLAAGSAVGGIVYDAKGPGGALIVAAVIATLGALTLLGRAGAAISSPKAAFGDLAREGGREAPAP